MSERRAADAHGLAWVAAALAWIAAVVVVDAALAEEAVLPVLLVLAPIGLAARVAPPTVFGVSLVTIGAGFFLGIPDGDWLTKRHLVTLVTLAAGGGLSVWIARLRRRLDTALAIATARATYDSLTGLLTRRAVLEAADELARIRYDSRADLSVAIVDIDHFKQVNDRHGHAAGDAVLADRAATWESGRAHDGPPVSA